MNRLKQMGLLASALVISIFNPSVYANNAGAYIQLSSSATQAATGQTNVAIFDKVAGKKGIDTIRDKVTFHEDGVYFIMASGQVGVIKPGSKASGDVDLWFLKNGEAIPDTTSRESVVAGSSNALIIQDVLSVKAGDTIGIGYASSNPLLGLFYLPATKNVPAIQSIVFTVYKVA